MVTIQAETTNESEGKRKFKFARKFKISKKIKTDKKNSPEKRKFSVVNFFRGKEKQPEIHFDSGYGEFCKLIFFANHKIIDSTTVKPCLCPDNKKNAKMALTFLLTQ